MTRATMARARAGRNGRKRRLMVILAIVGGTGLLALLSAPVWAPRVGLALPLPPPVGKRVQLSNGHHVNVFDEGRGTPVVLVHGLPGSAHDWHPLQEQMVGSGFRVIRYDRVGYGHSSRRTASESHGIASNAADLLQLLSALRLSAPIVIGWSYGGAVAQHAAEQRSSEIGGLLLVATDGPASRPSPMFARLFAWTLPLRIWGIRSGFPARLGVRRMAQQAFDGAAPAWWPNHAMAVLSPDGVARTWTKEVSEFDPTAIDPTGIDVPVTLVHGTNDRFVAPAVSASLHAALRGSVLVTVDGAGHMLPNMHAALVLEELNKLAVRVHDQ
jgi:non-heme chloroperoxidase